MNKQQKYRDRLVSNGLCPHCGKPCAPYYECEDRRIYKKSNIVLRKMVKIGILYCRRQPNGINLYRLKNGSIKITSYKTKDNDHRLLPRINNKPIDIEMLAIDILENADCAMSIDEISESIIEKISILKKHVRKPYQLKMKNN